MFLAFLFFHAVDLAVVGLMTSRKAFVGGSLCALVCCGLHGLWAKQCCLSGYSLSLRMTHPSRGQYRYGCMVLCCRAILCLFAIISFVCCNAIVFSQRTKSGGTCGLGSVRPSV